MGVLAAELVEVGDLEPLIVEIGSGVGEATAALAAGRPAYDVLAFEVWRPGVADTLWKLADVGAHNVRLIGVDAVWSLEHLVAPGGLAELWTFFPDPWPKTRHRKRRLVDPAFARLAVSRLAPGATWRLATDWADYAEQMREAAETYVRKLYRNCEFLWRERRHLVDDMGSVGKQMADIAEAEARRFERIPGPADVSPPDDRNAM